MRRPRLGQHFLHERRIIGRIISALAPGPGQRVVEIGPGGGALTAPLLDSGCELHAVELDRSLSAALTARFGTHPRFSLYCDDALDFDFRALAGSGTGSLRIIGNLPYQISTPLLFALFSCAEVIEDMHLMLQREVADRLCAEPGGRDYGRLSVAAHFQCQVERLFPVAPGAFKPPPAVRSAMLRLRPKTAAQRAQGGGMLPCVLRAAFGQRRKTLGRALAALLPAERLRELGIDPAERAERLAPAQFAAIAEMLADKGQVR